jgi:hypothetical protein
MPWGEYDYDMGVYSREYGFPVRNSARHSSILSPSAHHRSILAFMQTTGGKEHICIRPETQA